MKYVLAFLMLASIANAQQVRLPDDSNKLTVTVFANSDAEASAFLARHPEIARYKAGNHYNVYTQSNRMTGLRFGDQTHLSAYVCYPSGQLVISAKDTTCPLRHKKQKQEQQVDQGGVEGDEEAPPTEEPESGPSALALGLSAVLGLAIGVGGRFYKELKAK